MGFDLLKRKVTGRDWSLRGWDWQGEAVKHVPWRAVAIAGGAVVGALVVLSLFQPKRAMKRRGRTWGDYYDTRKRTQELGKETMAQVIKDRLK